MKRLYISVLALFSASPLLAQLPEDALRMTWNVPSGTARQQAIGGAMGALGGDISATFVNPAGLGFYKTNELVLSPGLSLLRSKSDFLGVNSTTKGEAKFHLGTSGIVWSNPGSGNWASKAFSLGLNRTANFNNTLYYKGRNDYSSYSEPLANEFFNYYSFSKDANPNRSDGAIIDDAISSNDVSLLTKMALYTYLVDLDSSSGNTNVISRAELAGVVDQENRVTTSGGITELAFGFAGNMDDQLYIGASIGVPIVNYSRTTEYLESDAAGTGNNEFTSSAYREDYTSKGMGINGKLGIIFKPVERLRLGLAVHTPTLYGLKDAFTASMETNIDTATGNQNVFNVTTADLYGGNNPNFQYDLVTPWKFMLSGALVLNESADITQQRGFISADVEYVSYAGSKFTPGQDGITDNYYTEVNETIKDIYAGALNFRVGGELKFNTLMTRLGFAYYGSPYADDNLKARRMNVSGGLGYRNKGMFVDLTYVHSLHRDVNFPYRVDPPRSNVLADIAEGNGNVLLTLGFKF